MPTDEEAWKVIKVWAEAMLPSSFGTINELAGFINKNNLNSPTSIASRQLLQKKLMQRELKERKKLTVSVDYFPSQVGPILCRSQRQPGVGRPIANANTSSRVTLSRNKQIRRAAKDENQHNEAGQKRPGCGCFLRLDRTECTLSLCFFCLIRGAPQ